jgi:hypothetical protein
VAQISYPQAGPQLDGLPPKLISVRRINVTRGVSWSLSITDVSCAAPEPQFIIDASSLIGKVSLAEALRVQEHSLPVGGTVAISLARQEYNFHPYSEAAIVQEQVGGSAISSINVK